jgi:hypothetical protein
MFDPYDAWLAIPRNQRPPTYYQLLGIAATETDRRVIEEAAIRRISQIRIYQGGPYERECIRLLNEIAAAETTLLHPARRQAYNAQLTQTAAEERNGRHGAAAPRQRPIVRFPALERRFAFPASPVAADGSPFENLGEPEPVIEFQPPPCIVSSRATEDPGLLFRFDEGRRRYRRRWRNHCYGPDAFVVIYLGCLILAGLLGFWLGG